MLRHLTIKHYALIESLEIDFDEGLNILTGETGSGKSIILGALGLILGERADLKVVQEGEQKCIVEGIFQVEKLNLEEIFKSHELDYDPNTIIRREILSSGKSRAFVNDTPVNLNVLKEIGMRLVDIHSQHQTIQINDPKFQLAVIDSYADTGSELKTYQNTYWLWQEEGRSLNRALERQRNSLSEADFTKYQLDELKAANLSDLDEEEMEEEYNNLAHADEISRSISEALVIIQEGEEPVLAALRTAGDKVGDIAGFSKSYEEISGRIESAIIELDDIARELERKLSSVELDPKRLEILEDLRSVIFKLEKKHGVEGIKALRDIQSSLESKLGESENLEEEIAELEKTLAGLRGELEVLGTALSKKRKSSFTGFSAALLDTLKRLNMPQSQFIVDLEKAEQPGLYGFDRINMLFSANAGRVPGPLKQIASGGELSRLMLAIKKMAASSSTGNTLVFDEIDTGVSGEVANAMGLIMKGMAANNQIICITHLPQIASKGGSHFKVYKREEKSKTYTSIERLTDEERIIEIAQMLSGAITTDAAMANARDLLELN